MKYKIRTAEHKDAEMIHDIYGYYVDNTCVTFSIENSSVDEYKKKMDQIKSAYPYLVAADDSDKVIGFVYGEKLRPHDAYIWNVEATIYLAPDAPKRQGVGAALYKEFMNRLSEQGYKYVYGVIEEKNEKSIAFHEALGFTKVGHFPNIGYKFGIWHGIVWYQKQIGDISQTGGIKLC